MVYFAILLVHLFIYVIFVDIVTIKYSSVSPFIVLHEAYFPGGVSVHLRLLSFTCTTLYERDSSMLVEKK